MNKISVLCACVAYVAMGAVVMAGADSLSAVGEITPPTIEHLAWCPAGLMYLDGPRCEAMTVGRPGAGLSDDLGNVFWGTRCLDKSTGIIKSIADDYWQTNFDVDEGPMSAFSNYEPYQADNAQYCRFVSGRPLEGGDKGCVYFADFSVGEVKRVWKNPEQENQWWFKKIAGGGKKPFPTSKGETVPALDVNLSGGMMIQVMQDDRLIIFNRGNFCELRDGELICIMGNKDHKSGTPKLGILAGDGTFYLGYYYGGAKRGIASVLRVQPDGTASPYVNGEFNTPVDGDAMHTGYFCGPHFWGYMHNYKFIPKDMLILCAHDDSYLRRARNGRVSTLCPDGRWRELAKGGAKKKALTWFRWLRGNMAPAPGPNGTAVVTMAYICQTSSFLVKGIDYDGPVVGPLLPIPSGSPKKKK